MRYFPNKLIGEGTTTFLNQFVNMPRLHGNIVLNGQELVAMPENISAMPNELKHTYLCCR